MTTLYLDRKGSALEVKNGVIHIALQNGDEKRAIPLKYVSRVVVRAETSISSNAICGLADNGIGLLIIGGRFGGKEAFLTGSFHNDAKRRWNQAIAATSPAFCSNMAASFIRMKVRRQLKTLQTMQDARPDLRKDLFDATAILRNVLQTLSFSNDTALGTLRGLEGAAAAAYFKAFFRAFAPALGVTGRNRRPPRDPVNAVLSLSYTLLCTRAATACVTAGLDPALGFYHSPVSSRPALACDIMEPFRPKIDLWVWNLFRNETLRPEHFTTDVHGGCLLGKAGRGHYYMAWELQSKRDERALLLYARRIVSIVEAVSDKAQWSHLCYEDTEHDSW